MIINFFGYEIVKGTRCAVAEFIINNLEKETQDQLYLPEITTMKIWVDAKKGTELKTVQTYIDEFGKLIESEDEWIVSYNVVTDEDVQRPDLTGYTPYELDNSDKKDVLDDAENTSNSINDNIILN